MQLRSSRFIDAERLLKVVPHNQLLGVQALLHKHLGDHREALRSTRLHLLLHYTLTGPLWSVHLVQYVVHKHQVSCNQHCFILAAVIFISILAFLCALSGGCSTFLPGWHHVLWCGWESASITCLTCGLLPFQAPYPMQTWHLLMFPLHDGVCKLNRVKFGWTCL